MYPQPRFPPAHTSATFEAVAVKKSMILTPAEIYAECAHHGEEKAAFGWLKVGARVVSFREGWVSACYRRFARMRAHNCVRAAR